MSRMATLLVLAAFLLPLLHASTWTWENYQGTSQWSVSVTDDETACGYDSPFYKTISVTIQHDSPRASTNDLPHGPWSGTFSGNTLYVPGRGVPDSGGTTVVPDVSIVFTPDCRGFSGGYHWSWSDSQQSCTGTVSFNGRRVGADSCPEQAPQPPPEPPPEVTQAQIADARHDLDGTLPLANNVNLMKWFISAHVYDAGRSPEPEDYADDYLKRQAKLLEQKQADVEAKYKALLQNDPTNFWLNWDMAELKKSEGDYHAYFDFLNAATDNKDIWERTRLQMRDQAQKDLGMSAPPTPATSPALNRLSKDVTGWSSGQIGDIMVDHSQPNWREKVTISYWAQKAMDKVRELGSP